MERESVWQVRNARVVTEESVYTGAVAIEGGRFAEVGPFRGSGCAVDFAGDYLLPGLVDLHTDNLERHFTPRPGVYWPDPVAALVAHDARMTAAGVTTIFDSVCAEAFPQEATRIRLFHDSIRALAYCSARGMLRGRHFLHLRCETADPEVLSLYKSTEDSPLLRLVSLMDHTPGQRQYRDENNFRAYYGSEGWTDEEFSAVVAQCKENQRCYAGRHRERIIERNRARGKVLASHDDTTAAHVRQAWVEGVRICEFPTTLEAAEEAARLGMAVVMGAPNIVMRGSHSGNVAALEVFRRGDLDILASDYVPESLLGAAFFLHRNQGLDLPQALCLVARNPARALGLEDLGSVAPGQRADFLRVALQDDTPEVKGVWRDGLRIY